jgi:hypothetical protein
MLTVYSRDQCDCYFFITQTLSLSEYALTVSPSSITTETDSFKEEKFTNFWSKAAKKVSMLVLFLRDQCNCVILAYLQQ